MLNEENREFYLTKEWQDYFKLFWVQESACYYYVDNLQSKMAFKKCDDATAYWSSFYPDPKSNITDMIELDLALRIL